jgi:hypothetical protein
MKGPLTPGWGGAVGPVGRSCCGKVRARGAGPGPGRGTMSLFVITSSHSPRAAHVRLNRLNSDSTPPARSRDPIRTGRPAARRIR